MNPLNWVELTRQFKVRNGFGWSTQGIENQNKVLTKIINRFSLLQSNGFIHKLTKFIIKDILCKS